MQTLQEIMDLLMKTPEMAIYGLVIWCVYILAKLASIVYAVKAVLTVAINKMHDYKTKKIQLKIDSRQIEYDKKNIELEKKYQDIIRLSKIFQGAAISSLELDDLRALLNSMKSTSYIHQSDIQKAIKKLSA